MIRAAALLAFASCLLGCALAAGCAAPGEPTSRHPVVPLPVTDLAVRQYGNSFLLGFDLPTRSADREPLSEHPSIEIYRAQLPPGAVPDRKTPWRLAYTIPPEQVDRYLHGERIEFPDPLSADDFAVPAGSLLAYKVRTRAVKARASEDSNIVVARIYPAPEAPRDVRVEVTESALVVNWEEVPLPPEASSRAYRVYRGLAESEEGNPPPEGSKAKAKPTLELAGTSPSSGFHDPHFEFGKTYEYVVRTVAQFGANFVESADSAPVFITPRDVFPPGAPTGLEATVVPAAPGASAYVELSWSISSEADLAGYAVYRGEGENSPGERISTETLLSPAFRDMSVASGRRYFYRVSALDRSGNESPKSSAMAVDVP